MVPPGRPAWPPTRGASSDWYRRGRTRSAAAAVAHGSATCVAANRAALGRPYPASAQPDDSDPALFAELTTVFPGTDIHSPEELSAGWGNLQAADVVWVREKQGGSGALVFGELVYDSASSKPCRTGFLCGRAQVDRGVIDSLALEAADGAIDEGTVVTSRYPYVEGRWIAADDATSSESRRASRGSSTRATPRSRAADESRPAAGCAVARGTAVAASSGGEEARQAQPNGLLPAGLVEGAPVTIRDASSGEVIGTGTVSSTTFVQLTDETTPAGPPPWTCTFDITATVSSTPESITVQVGELAPLGPTSLGGSGGFSVSVPSSGTGGTELQPAVDTTAVDTTAVDTTAVDRPPSTRPPSTRPPTTRTRPSGRSASTPRPPRSPTAIASQRATDDVADVVCRVAVEPPSSRAALLAVSSSTPASRCRRGP